MQEGDFTWERSPQGAKGETLKLYRNHRQSLIQPTWRPRLFKVPFSRDSLLFNSMLVDLCDGRTEQDAN